MVSSFRYTSSAFCLPLAEQKSVNWTRPSRTYRGRRSSSSFTTERALHYQPVFFWKYVFLFPFRHCRSCDPIMYELGCRCGMLCSRVSALKHCARKFRTRASRGLRATVVQKPDLFRALGVCLFVAQLSLKVSALGFMFLKCFIPQVCAICSCVSVD